MEDKGLGGATKVWFNCSGGGYKIYYTSFKMALTHYNRNCVSLATALCFLVYGQGYYAYFKVLKIGLGINILSSGIISIG